MSDSTAFPFEFTQAKLLESLHNMHESSRLAREAETEEKKLKGLTAIRDQLGNDTQQLADTMQPLLDNISVLETNIANLKSEVTTGEEKVVLGFQDILLKLKQVADDKAESHRAKVKKELQDYVRDSSNQLDARIKVLETSVANLETSKLDVSAEDRLKQAIEAGKQEIIAVQRESLANMRTTNDTGLQELQTRVHAQLEQFAPDKITQEIMESTLSSMEPHLRTFIAETRAQNEKLMEDYKASQSDKLKEYVKQAVLEHVDQNNLQKIIVALPEFQNLQQLATEISNRPRDESSNLRNSPEIAALKESVRSLTSEMAQIKQVTDSTRALVATLKEHGVPEPSQVAQFDLAASVKHIDDINKDLTVMYNSIKMMEAVIGLNTMQGTASRKRRRTTSEEDGEITVDQDEEIMLRLAKIEERQDMLQDFIFQYERTILHENYTDRVNASMQKIHNVLLNHERFIAFLVNPFAAGSREIVLPEATTKPSDAMVEAIQTIVRQKAEEFAAPLQNQIKVLEEKLNLHQ